MSAFAEFNARDLFSSNRDQIKEQTPLLKQPDRQNKEAVELAVKNFDERWNEEEKDGVITKVTKTFVDNIYESTLSEVRTVIQNRTMDIIPSKKFRYHLPTCAQFQTAGKASTLISTIILRQEDAVAYTMYSGSIETISVRSLAFNHLHPCIKSCVAKKLEKIAEDAISQLNQKFQDLKNVKGNEDLRISARVASSRSHTMVMMDNRYTYTTIKVTMHQADYRKLSIFQTICELTCVPCVFPCCPVWF